MVEGKRGLDGFATTNLDFILRSRKIENVAIAGFLTNCCVESTMRTAYELGYKTTIHVQSWVDGRSRPPVWQLLALAELLKADPVDVILGWVIDQCPELEDVLRAQIFDLRGSRFPRSTDLALRAPKPFRRNI